MTSRALFTSLLLSVVAAAAAGSQPGARAPIPVLFIGNSLTSANDLPRVVEALSAGSEAPIQATAVVRDGFSLDDHWADGDARRVIARGGWAFVVLQQGPSALPESQQLLRAAAKRYAPLIRQAGARPALYMVWPSRARMRDFDGVRASYAAAAADVGGVFIPAGEAWREVWRRDPDFMLYGPDGFHPSRAGTYVAALAIVQALTGRAATTLTGAVPSWPADWIRPGDAALLRSAVQGREGKRVSPIRVSHEAAKGREGS